MFSFIVCYEFRELLEIPARNLRKQPLMKIKEIIQESTQRKGQGITYFKTFLFSAVQSFSGSIAAFEVHPKVLTFINNLKNTPKCV
jgi:hypothetical protein